MWVRFKQFNMPIWEKMSPGHVGRLKQYFKPVLNYGLSPARVQEMGRGILRSLGFTTATLQSRLTAFHTCPISDVVVGMTKFKLSSGSSSATEWWTGSNVSCGWLQDMVHQARWINCPMGVALILEKVCPYQTFITLGKIFGSYFPAVLSTDSTYTSPWWGFWWLVPNSQRQTRCRLCRSSTWETCYKVY